MSTPISIQEPAELELTLRGVLLKLIELDPNRTYSVDRQEWAHNALLAGHPHNFAVHYSVSCQPGIDGQPCYVKSQFPTLQAALDHITEIILADNARIAATTQSNDTAK